MIHFNSSRALAFGSILVAVVAPDYMTLFCTVFRAICNFKDRFLSYFTIVVGKGKG